MTVLTWITLWLLYSVDHNRDKRAISTVTNLEYDDNFKVVLAETVSTEPQCDANHTKLLLLVDVRRDPSLTVTRIKNIASYFISRVMNGVIKTLDVCLLDPFQEITLFNLTSVTSSEELTSAFEQIDRKYVISNDYKQISSDKSNLSFTFEHLDKIVNENVKGNIYIVAFLSSYHLNSGEHYPFSGLHYKTKSILKFTFLFDNFLYVYTNLNNTKNEYGINRIVPIGLRDDFHTYNPVISFLCGDCTRCWTTYFLSGRRQSIYMVEILDSPISWSKANKICNSKSSSLPAIETNDELQFLKEFLQNITITTDDPSMSLIRNTVVISVSLFKKRGLQLNKFMWLNLRPFNLEVNFESSEDPSESIVAITFLFKGKNETDEIKWKAVNCDQPMSEILVCEMEDKKFINNPEQIDKILATVPTRQNGSMHSIIDYFKQLNILKLNESEEMFHCNDAYNEMVFYGFVCDGKGDCDNGRDEQFCPTLLTNSEQSDLFCITRSKFQHIATYIPVEKRCNMIQDCPDNSDEQGCDGCLGRQCEDFTCVPSHWLSRDREKCHLFIGTNRNWYLNVSYPCTSECSGIVNFHHEITFCDVNIGNSSERQTFHVDTRNVEWAPKCLYLRGSDGSTTGCHNNRHLRDCRTFQCPEGFLKCPDSYCVSVYNFGDKQSDCPYGEDEILNLYDRILQIDKLFKCLKSNIFIHLVHICDGVPHCPYGEDEAFCNVTCPPGFDCNGQAVKLANQKLGPKIKSLNIFDFKTKYLNLSGINLNKVKEAFILPNLLEFHASNCNLENLDKIFQSDINMHKNLYSVNLSYNKIKKLLVNGPLYRLTNLQFLNLSNNKYLSKIEQESIWPNFLHTIDLSFTQITVFEFRTLEQYQSIRSLNLFQTNIIQIGSLILIKRLEYFNLQKTLLSSENIIRILKEVSVSTSLHVDNFKFCCPQISGAGTPRHACHAPLEAFSSCEDLLSDVLKRSLLWLVAGLSLAGNIIVVTYRLFYDKSVFKKGYGVFVTNLSVSDCVMGVYLLIIASTDVRYRDEYVLHESDWRHSSLCQAAGFLSTLSSETSTFFVFLITFDRYLVIRFPFGDHRFTKLGLVLCVIFVWITGFILASVPLMYPEWIIYSSNGMCLGLPLGISRNLGWHYSLGIFICVNFIMFIFIACGQMIIFRLISSSHNFQMTNVQSVARRVQDINVAKQLCFVAFSNFLCWFPICVLGFLTLTGHQVSPDTYSWLVVFVMPLNAAINPMIYTIPVMYSKWQDFKKGDDAKTRRPVNKE